MLVWPSLTVSLFLISVCVSMDGADLCFEIVKRADAGFVYSEAVARWDFMALIYFPKRLPDAFLKLFESIFATMIYTNT